MLAFLWSPSTKMIGLHCFLRSVCYRPSLLTMGTSQIFRIMRCSHIYHSSMWTRSTQFMSLPRSLVSKICALISLCWNREWWIFSRFPHPFNRLPKKKLGASGDISDRQRVTSKWRRLRCLRNVPLSRRLNCWRFLLICRWRSQKPERYEK